MGRLVGGSDRNKNIIFWVILHLSLISNNDNNNEETSLSAAVMTSARSLSALGNREGKGLQASLKYLLKISLKSSLKISFKISLKISLRNRTFTLMSPKQTSLKHHLVFVIFFLFFIFITMSTLLGLVPGGRE